MEKLLPYFVLFVSFFLWLVFGGGTCFLGTGVVVGGWFGTLGVASALVVVCVCTLGLRPVG